MAGGRAGVLSAQSIHFEGATEHGIPAALQQRCVESFHNNALCGLVSARCVAPLRLAGLAHRVRRVDKMCGHRRYGRTVLAQHLATSKDMRVLSCTSGTSVLGALAIVGRTGGRSSGCL